MTDPIQVFENHSGPQPSRSSTIPPGTYKYAWVAYRDAEADHHIYGYGHTQSDAIADYVRNTCEAHCSNCPGCEDSQQCILTSGEIATLVFMETERWYATHSPTHSNWRALNNKYGAPQQ